MNIVETVSLIAAVASLVLAIVAISLSIVFYRMSSQLSESAKDAAKDIGASVQKLEKLFDKLYTDTFSIMKDTVTDMRKHIWPTESSSEKREKQMDREAEMKADQKVEALKAQVQENIEDLLKRSKLTEARLGEVKGEMSKIMDNVISKSRKAEHEAREETLRENIIRIYTNKERGKGYVRADVIVNKLRSEFDARNVVEEIKKMREEGVLSFDDELLGPSTEIRLGK